MPWLAIPSSRLVGVVGVGGATEAEGVTVELLALEIREDGAIVHWRARAAREVALLMPDVTVADERSTECGVATAQGGGGGRDWHGETMFVPAPPTGVTLIIEVTSFGPPPCVPPMPGYVAFRPLPARGALKCLFWASDAP